MHTGCVDVSCGSACVEASDFHVILHGQTRATKGIETQFDQSVYQPFVNTHRTTGWS
jgi:hypothetical protein